MTLNLVNVDSQNRGPVPVQRKRRLSRQRQSIQSKLVTTRGRLLYGDLGRFGFAFAMHDFLPGTELNWASGFQPNSVEICLNLEGRGRVGELPTALDFGPKTAGFYHAGTGGLRATRAANERHRFMSIHYSVAYLRGQLSVCDGALHPLVECLCNGAGEPQAPGEVRALSLDLEQLAAQLSRPPVAQAARPLWYHSKALQLMADFFFTRPGDDELFCDRQKRVARQRADAVVAILRQHLDEPLGLEAIARKVGCSPFYLSRTFSQETGMTIPQYLRRIRMERAAELLQSGKYNVTEAALEVGYSSLSHFSQAFCQTMGCCPALYPLQHRPVSLPPQTSVKE